MRKSADGMGKVRWHSKGRVVKKDKDGVSQRATTGLSASQRDSQASMVLNQPHDGARAKRRHVQCYSI